MTTDNVIAIIDKLVAMWDNENPLDWSLEFEALIDKAYHLIEFADKKACDEFDALCAMMDADTREYVLDNYC